jgi:outer membrane protein assembly factor BamB
MSRKLSTMLAILFAATIITVVIFVGSRKALLPAASAQGVSLGLSVGAPLPPDAKPTLRLVVKKTSDILVTTYRYVGSSRIGSTSFSFGYDPEPDLRDTLKAAGFTVVTADSDQLEDAALFVRYSEYKRPPGGLDAPTARDLSYVVFHRIAGKVLSGSTKKGGCNTPDELKGDPEVKELPSLLEQALKAGSSAVTVDIPGARPAAPTGTGPLLRVPEDIDPIDQIVLGRDRKSVAYVGRKEGRCVIGGVGVPELSVDLLVDRPVFHPWGTALGCIVEDNGACYVTIGGKVGYAFARVGGLSFSGDGKHFSYIATLGKKQCVVSDGQVGERYDAIRTMVTYGEGGRSAYWAESDKKWVLVLDGTPKETAWVDATRPSFGPDGGVAYAAKKDGAWYLVTGETERRLGIDGEVLAGPIFGQNPSAFVLVMKSGGFRFVALGETPLRKTKGDIGMPVVSPDGKHVAYTVKEEGDAFVVVNNGESARYDDVDAPAFSADGASVTFAARKDSEIRLEEARIAELKVIRTKEPLWTLPVGPFGRGSAAHVARGALFVSTADCTVRAMDLAARKELWSFKTGPYPVAPRIAVGDGIVYALHINHAIRTLFAIDATSGAELWKYSGGSSFSAPALVTPAAVYVVDHAGICALNPKTGKRLWSKRMPHRFTQRMVVDNGSIYLSGHGDELLVLDGKTGDEVRRLKGIERDAAVVGTANALLLVRVGSQVLCAIDPQTGKEAWRFKAPETMSVIRTDEDILLTFGATALALDPATGKERWRCGLAAPARDLRVCPAALYAITDDMLYAVDPKTGAELWRYAAEGICAPALLDDVLLFGAGGHLCAVKSP